MLHFHFVSSLGLFSVCEDGEREKASCLMSFFKNKDTKCIIGAPLMTSPKPDYLPKAPSPNTVTCRLGLQHVNWGAEEGNSFGTWVSLEMHRSEKKALWTVTEWCEIALWVKIAKRGQRSRGSLTTCRWNLQSYPTETTVPPNREHPSIWAADVCLGR